MTAEEIQSLIEGHLACEMCHVDGDGRQEVQIGYRWYDGQGQAIYHVEGERIMLLFRGGASV